MEASHLILAAILLLTALALVMSGIAIMFQLRRDRLPDATRFENIRELRAQEEQLLAERRAELSIVEQKIQQRDRLIAEVAGLEERRIIVMAELASLDSARHEIEEVKSEAAAAAADLSLITQDIAIKREELERLNAECNPGRVAELQQEIERLNRERGEINSTLPNLRVERDNALQRIEEANGLHARIAALEVDRDKLEDEIDDRQVKLERLRNEGSDLKEVQAVVTRLREEASRLEVDLAKQDLIRTEIQKLESDRARLTSEISSIGVEVAQLQQAKLELANTRARCNELADEVNRLVARKERLDHELGGGSNLLKDPKELLEDLMKMPACLQAPSIIRGTPRTEADALHAVSDYLERYDLDYSRRTVHAFHTALKVNDNSQLTVLAGVSGTGKSLLPRRYAEAIGIHFLQIAVEPRWDSPQDLLGFYNYIEKNYRATDLARMLVHMDPFTSLKSAAKSDYADHMALVLLDEMNLARVEYYFSEFLSWLEARPRYNDAGDERKRADALIPVDIRGLKSPISLFPSHNVLFAGTMNDDESTQALSDKVLDRSNILQFAAPNFEPHGEFRRTDSSKKLELPNEAQSFKSWRAWVRPSSSFNGASLVDL